MDQPNGSTQWIHPMDQPMVSIVGSHWLIGSWIKPMIQPNIGSQWLIGSLDQTNDPTQYWLPMVHWIIGSNQQSNPMDQPNGSNQWINPMVQPNGSTQWINPMVSIVGSHWLIGSLDQTIDPTQCWFPMVHWIIGCIQ